METTTLLLVCIMIALILSLILYSIIVDNIIRMSTNNSFSSLPSITQNLSDIVRANPKPKPSPAINYIALADFTNYTSKVTTYMDSLIIISELTTVISCVMISGLIIFIIYKFYRKSPESSSIFASHSLANEMAVDDNFWKHYLPKD